eukprot:CAMPEP_0114277328 /NCGR_PEP_ID=MMETSP0059-20121206/732_1 /TAXON_ID=36894 /ORGANISM="Pyramimonas parkeae, Strain CCMP726" /LENGTH=243 /DNA_ID=CAMNT_0001397427 /DNA_START=160 /DNA_END=891 /DNA_ORIENTATION=-
MPPLPRTGSCIDTAVFCKCQPLNDGGGGRCRSHRDAYLQARPDNQIVKDLLFGQELRRIVECLLGGPACLYNEQYIVKPPNCERAVFKWHTDADFQEEGTERKPYLSVWCALDDVHEDNGTLYLLPYPPSPESSRVLGNNDATTCGEVSEDALHRAASERYPDRTALQNPGMDEGTPVIISRGSAVIMSDRLLHCSSGNMSENLRRVWMPQFSLGPVLRQTADEMSRGRSRVPASLAVPLTAS